MEKHKEYKALFGIFKRLSRSKGSLPATASTAGASGTATAFSHSDNSAATSKNLQAASVRLDDYLVSADRDEDRTKDVVSMSRWVEKTEMYTNASLAGHDMEQISFAPFPRELINLAAISSKLVYGQESTPSRVQSGFVPGEATLHLDADVLGGSVKATTVRHFRSSSAAIIVVSLRGTTSIHDWMVNFNDEADTVTARDFLGVSPDPAPYEVHGGFLKCAKTMTPKLAEKILQMVLKLPLQESCRPELLFTGHSAGGAVAALLYAHLTNKIHEPDEFIRLKSKFSKVHCITFGAPPVSRPRLQYGSPASIFLSVINEGDPIPRIDREYIDSLLRLYVCPMPTTPRKWDLPKMELYNAGEVILLRKWRSPFVEESEDRPPFFHLPERGEGSLEDTVMGDPRVHMMNEYLRRLQLVA